MPLNIHFFQHVPFEGLGTMEDWVYNRGHRLSRTAWWNPHPRLPSLDQFDILIVMGGPMGVYETSQHPWLSKEIPFIQKTIEAGKPVLGICLGSQLIAAALGQAVYSSGHKEIGWFPIHLTSPARGLEWFFPGGGVATVFHWHGDTFDLPAGAQLLASSDLTPHQAFLWKDRVLGLQFHLETDREALEAFVATGASEMVPAPGVQSPEEALEATALHAEACQTALGRILARWETLASSVS